MKWALVLLPFILSGCLATPKPIVKQSFPVADKDLLTPCPELKLVDPKTTKLTDVLETVIDNYNEYHSCKSKVDEWITWYNEQKKIFDSVK